MAFILTKSIFKIKLELRVPRTNAAASNVECRGYRLRWFFKGYSKSKVRGKYKYIILGDHRDGYHKSYGRGNPASIDEGMYLRI